MYALEYGRTSIVKLLLKAGANKEITNNVSHIDVLNYVEEFECGPCLNLKASLWYTCESFSSLFILNVPSVF